MFWILYHNGQGKPELNYPAFLELVSKAPMLVEWLNILGKLIQTRFPRLQGLNFEAKAEMSTELPTEAIALSPQKMLESFDQFAYPRRIEGGERTLLTVRTIVRAAIERADGSTHSIRSASGGYFCATHDCSILTK